MVFESWDQLRMSCVPVYRSRWSLGLVVGLAGPENQFHGCPWVCKGLLCEAGGYQNMSMPLGAGLCVPMSSCMENAHFSEKPAWLGGRHTCEWPVPHTSMVRSLYYGTSTLGDRCQISQSFRDSLPGVQLNPPPPPPPMASDHLLPQAHPITSQWLSNAVSLLAFQRT